MLARSVFAILVIGLTAGVVLSTRQARLQAAHELTQARLRAALLDERLAEKRAVIAEVTTPQRLVPSEAIAASPSSTVEGERDHDESSEARLIARELAAGSSND
ncbi:MAG: hypothetical protein AAGI53_08795 [Planctomycetota bacterium]